jgi:hypothetical protein
LQEKGKEDEVRYQDNKLASFQLRGGGGNLTGSLNFINIYFQKISRFAD